MGSARPADERDDRSPSAEACRRRGGRPRHLRRAGGLTPEALLLLDDEEVAAERPRRCTFVASSDYHRQLIPLEQRFTQLYDLEADPGEDYSVVERYLRLFEEEHLGSPYCAAARANRKQD